MSNASDMTDTEIAALCHARGIDRGRWLVSHHGNDISIGRAREGKSIAGMNTAVLAIANEIRCDRLTDARAVPLADIMDAAWLAGVREGVSPT